MLCICTIMYFNTSEWIFLDLWSYTYVLIVITINAIKWCSHIGIFSYLCHYTAFILSSYIFLCTAITWYLQTLYHLCYIVTISPCNSSIFTVTITLFSTFLSHNHYPWVIKLCKISVALPLCYVNITLCIISCRLSLHAIPIVTFILHYCYSVSHRTLQLYTTTVHYLNQFEILTLRYHYTRSLYYHCTCFRLITLYTHIFLVDLSWWENVRQLGLGRQWSK